MEEPEAITVDNTEQTPEVTPQEATIPANVISFKHVNISQRKLRVLTDISFNMKQGEFVYLIGKTGTGKSSILKTLIGELKPEGEEAMMIGYDLLNLKKKQIPEMRKKIGVVFQDYQLLQDRTVIENLMFVLRATQWKDKSAMLNRCEEVLTLVGLETKDFKLPSQLSGGEQQRVCIARALLNSPDLILADEPTGNLDPDTTLEVMKLLRRISENGQAVLMATHNYTLMQKYPSRIANCMNGTVICSEME